MIHYLEKRNCGPYGFLKNKELDVPILFADEKSKIRHTDPFANENLFFRKSSVKTCVKSRE